MGKSHLLAAAAASVLMTGPAGGLPIQVDTGRMLMKATPSMEGGVRCVYFQASTRARDVQGERILAQALIRSIPYFLRHGRIDLDHASVPEKDSFGNKFAEIRGQRVDPYAYEIGRPLDAKAEGDSVMVKAAIFSSKDKDNRWTMAADLFWDSLHVTPPVLWYPSVQGMVTNEQGVIENNLKIQEVGGILWQTVGFSRTPVNPSVPNVTTVPLRVFAKALGQAKSISALLAEMRGVPTAPVVVEGDDRLPDAHVIAVLEGLADGGSTTPSDFLASMEAKGLPQASALAVLLALMTPSL